MRGPLDRLAALDPTGLVGTRVVDVARRVPGVAAGERIAQRVEGAVLRELSRRLDEATGTGRELGAGEAVDGPVSVRRTARPSAPELMNSLLRASIDQDPAGGERSLMELMIGDLVPDEARMLAALSDGTTFPLIDIVARGGTDTGRVLLANVSSVGRQAGVVLPDRVPVYLAHMLSLGLLQRGGEDGSLREEYEILLTDPAVIKARSQPGAGLRRPRVVRGTVRIADLGRSVWAAAQRS
jgi:hypothetical protein